MSFVDLEVFINREEVELDKEELDGTVLVPGQLVFVDAYAPTNGGNDEYAERYGVTFRVPQDSEHMSKLFAVADHVGQNTWKRDFEEKMEAVWGGVDGGVSAKNSNINIHDGNLIEPKHNKGTFQIKASRREDEGPPVIVVDGEALTWDPNDKESVKEAKKAGPKVGDFCWIQLNVWCQKKRERINFTLAGIQLVERGKLVAKTTDKKTVVAGFAKAKALPTGFMKSQKAIAAKAEIVEDEEESEEEEEEEAPKRTTKVAVKAKAKTAPKKVASKGVFRKR